MIQGLDLSTQVRLKIGMFATELVQSNYVAARLTVDIR
jgi:hypothetical protein